MARPLRIEYPNAVHHVTSRGNARNKIFLGDQDKEASRRANAHCLRPQAEFARASGRGHRRVKNFIKDAKGMCKKTMLSRSFEVYPFFATLRLCAKMFFLLRLRDPSLCSGRALRSTLADR